jgi:protein-L-isoaspartate(D-aspartate) O-methyltransferase
MVTREATVTLKNARDRAQHVVGREVTGTEESASHQAVCYNAANMLMQWLARMKATLGGVNVSHPDAPSDAPWLHGWPEIYDTRVRAAFTRVPRAAFVGSEMQAWATRDTALPIEEGQTISQPFVVALMTQALELQPGLRVLEIGTGSGYQTAILCELTAHPEFVRGENIWSVERYETLARQAAKVLTFLGYRPHLFVGDGAAGWRDAAPYDAVMVTAAAPALPRPLWDQLADGGRLVIPIGSPNQGQELWLVVKQGRHMVRRALGGVRFVPFISPILDDATQRIEFDERRD